MWRSIQFGQWTKAIFESNCFFPHMFAFVKQDLKRARWLPPFNDKVVKEASLDSDTSYVPTLWKIYSQPYSRPYFNRMYVYFVCMYT